MTESTPRCSFCGRQGYDGRRVIAGAGTKETGSVGICEECVALCTSILDDPDPSVLPTYS